MTDLSKQNKRNRSAGKAFERDLMRWFRDHGFDYERTRDTGTNDEGDGVIRHDGHYIVVEAKNAKLEPTQFLREAELEAEHFAEHRGLPAWKVHPVAMVKRRGKGTSEALVLMTADSFANLIARIGKVR